MLKAETLKEDEDHTRGRVQGYTTKFDFVHIPYLCKYCLYFFNTYKQSYYLSFEILEIRERETIICHYHSLLIHNNTISVVDIFCHCHHRPIGIFIHLSTSITCLSPPILQIEGSPLTRIITTIQSTIYWVKI